MASVTVKVDISQQALENAVNSSREAPLTPCLLRLRHAQTAWLPKRAVYGLTLASRIILKERVVSGTVEAARQSAAKTQSTNPNQQGGLAPGLWA